MASLSNINGLFDVHSTGAILFSTSHGTSGQILRSNGNAAPTWVAASTVIGGPYLPLAGGTLTGATETATGISFTVGGNLFVTGTSTFNGDMTLPAAADHFLIGAGSLQTTGRIKFGLPSWNNSIGLESYWMVMRSNSNEGYKFIDSGGNTYVQFNASTNSAGAYNSTFAGNVDLGDSSNISMSAGSAGQLQVKGLGYTGAIALDATAMYIYHNSSLRDLVLGTNETARLTIDGSAGNATFAGTLQSGNFAIGATPSSFGSGVSTITLQGTAANSRSGAIVFKEQDGTVTTNIYSTDGSDGYGTVINAAQGSFKVNIGALASTKLEVTDYGSLVVGNTPGTNVNWGKIQCGGTITVGNSSGTYITHGRISGDSDGMKLKGTSTGTYSDPQGVTINGYNVGINTNSPNVGNAFGLVIRSWATLSRLVFWNNTSGEVSSRGQRISFQNANCIFENMESGYYAFKTGGSSANPSERMRITSDGGILINDTSSGYGPVSYGYMLGIQGSATQSYMSMNYAGGALDTQGMVFGVDSNGGVWLHRENKALRLYTNNTERMIVQGGGDVIINNKAGIGTTSPKTKLDIQGTTGTRNRNTTSGETSSVFETSRYYGVAGNATTNVSIDTSVAFPPMASGGYILVEVSASGYGSGGTNGLIFSYITGGYGGHYAALNQPYHPVTIIVNTMQNGTCTWYNPDPTTIGITIANGSSTGVTGVMRVKVTTTY